MQLRLASLEERRAAEASVPAPSGGLGAAQVLLGTAPPARPRALGSSVAAGSALATAPAPPSTLPEAEGPTCRHGEGGEVDLNTAVKLLLAQQLQKEKKHRKRIDGVDSDPCEGDSDEGFGNLPGGRPGNHNFQGTTRIYAFPESLHIRYFKESLILRNVRVARIVTVVRILI